MFPSWARREPRGLQENLKHFFFSIQAIPTGNFRSRNPLDTLLVVTSLKRVDFSQNKILNKVCQAGTVAQVNVKLWVFV